MASSFSLSLLKKTIIPSTTSRCFATGARGTRGHGWYHKYKQGLGGRHLQGRFSEIDITKNWNNQVFDSLHTEFAFLDIQVDNQEIHQVVLELATEALPKTCRNFQLLMKDNYKNTKIHHLEKQVGLCLGDVLLQDGKGGKCHDDMGLYGTMPEEHKLLWHLEGIVTMLVPSVDKVDSRFMILTHDAPHLNGKHLPFGRVTSESLGLLRGWQEGIFTQRGKPSVDMVIVDCGMMETKKNDGNVEAA